MQKYKNMSLFPGAFYQPVFPDTLEEMHSQLL